MSPKHETPEQKPPEQKPPEQKPPEQKPPENELDDTGPFANLLFFVVGGGKEKRQAFMMRVSQTFLKEKNLHELKAKISKKDYGKEYVYLSFCNEGGAVVDESLNIQDYINSVKESEKPNPATETETHGVYLKRRYKRTDLDGTSIPKVKLELPDDVTYLNPVELEKLSSTLNLLNWKAAQGTNPTPPTELLEEDWQKVVLNNSICYGLSIVRLTEDEETIPIGIKRARYPAFQIKTRKVALKEPKPEVRIPDYVVDDQSYVTICETKSHFQNSLSESAITTWDILYSAAMSFAGVQLGASAGYKHSISKQKTKLTKGDTARMNVSYNFPRTTLILDQHSLELTAECKADLEKVHTEETMRKFLELYGEYFSQEVQLGGRLYASEDFKWEGESSSDEVKKSLTVQAASSLKGEINGVGLSGGPEEGVTHSKGNESGNVKSHMQNALQWQANGGDTLLCNNPPAWCPTVASHLNWRIINRAENCHLLDLLAEFPNQERLRNFVKKNADYRQLNKALQPRAGRTFYLRNGSLFQYLTFYQKECIPGKIKWALPKDSPFIGTAIMAPQVEDCNLYGCYFEFETLEKVPVAKVEYNKAYLLRNPSTELYLNYYDVSHSRWLISSKNPPTQDWPVYVRASDGTKDGEVDQGDRVTLRLGTPKAELGSLVTQGKWEGNFGRLYAHTDMVNVVEKEFQLLYKDKEPPKSS